MSLHRKQIILNEIAFWKKSKLLPEHYCDFLTALYAQGESSEIEEKDNSSKAVLAKEKWNKRVLYIMLGVTTSVILASLVFMTTLAFIPILLAGITVLGLLFIAFKSAKNKSVMTPFLLICSALLLLGASFKIWDVYFADYPSVLIGLIISNCLIWLFSGLLLKLVYFSISGIIGIALILFYLFRFYV
ncbi:hypothetical protein [Psychrobacillus vulpis]|uniref:Uncharacterized protein n=1 Tax=Psychrobacillus vulpis TaxID=2325572 RepID=A0A544TPY1_9BACI|nr:hypothetical protein [Psychrobacillus vulpis]TQR19518.1 hypothetical protein FG384_11330 [Psychrobacillus vulpis]